MSQRSVPAPFLTKTYQLVDEGSTNDVVSWNESGNAFVVWKMDEFSRNLLPTYFKHNNFSSFVRQLNTYGFRKTVPDKWEFSNDNFKRGEKELLAKIRRRKSAAPSPSPALHHVAAQMVLAHSGEELGSDSTSTSSSRDSKNPGSVDTSNVATLGVILLENKRLKTENHKLNSELAQTKRQRNELLGFLGRYVRVGSDQISHIVSQGEIESSHDDCVDTDGLVGETGSKSVNNDECDDDENGECLKLFGVWMKEKKKKRDREEMMNFGGAHRKDMHKALAKFGAPLMKVGSYHPGESSKVCN